MSCYEAKLPPVVRILFGIAPGLLAWSIDDKQRSTLHLSFWSCEHFWPHPNKQYLLCRAEFIAWRLRDQEHFGLATHESCFVRGPHFKWPCVKFYRVGGTDKYLGLLARRWKEWFDFLSLAHAHPYQTPFLGHSNRRQDPTNYCRSLSSSRCQDSTNHSHSFKKVL